MTANNDYFDHPNRNDRLVDGDTARARDVNKLFDAVSSAFTAVETDLSKTITLPDGATTASIPPAPADRAHQLLAFDSSGNVTVLPGGGPSVRAGKMLIYDQNGNPVLQMAIDTATVQSVYSAAAAAAASQVSASASQGAAAASASLAQEWASSAAGFAAAADSARLQAAAVAESVADGPVVSVNGHHGAVTLSAADVGLSHVDNTADVDKPISDAQRTELDALRQYVDQNKTTLATIQAAALSF
ncbi:hypothetical protein DFO50_10970 [Microvirgula sp. AG722]|uniref:hypothetical protein n=1 Tax=Microvirgula sp. AG722 TaxID=2183901 RepID=UPI000DC3BBB0|nr:hypothetical protein [Microvirgula sp. AG722]RAS14815.1 hypothetical protein DFO50_10970 [Microvirgula sp. AG722]